MAVVDVAAPPALPLSPANCAKPRAIVALLLLMWVPLVALRDVRAPSSATRCRISCCCRPFRRRCCSTLIAVGVVARIAGRGHRRHAGLLLAVRRRHGALSAADRSRTSRSRRSSTPFTGKKEHCFYWLGADFKGRDMLSRTIWGCQRVLVWGITATLVAYVVGTHARPDRRLSRRLVGPGDLASSPTCSCRSR